MGFSLKAALAGAIQGGAHAVGEIADFQIKEQSRLREREEMRVQRIEEMRYQDELLANRERRVDELKTAREESQRKSKAVALQGGLASLREAGVDAGSIKGQQMLATKLADAGYTELADKYFDNAIRLGQIESAEGLRKEEMRLRHATIAESRANRDAATTDREYMKGYNAAVHAGEKLRIADPTDPGKSQNFSAAGSSFGSLFGELVDAKIPQKKAVSIVGEAATTLSQAISMGADPHEALLEVLKESKLKTGLLKPEAVPASPPSSLRGAPPPAEKKYIPGTIYDKNRPIGEGFHQTEID